MVETAETHFLERALKFARGKAGVGIPAGRCIPAVQRGVKRVYGGMLTNLFVAFALHEALFAQSCQFGPGHPGVEIQFRQSKAVLFKILRRILHCRCQPLLRIGWQCPQRYLLASQDQCSSRGFGHPA